MGATEWTWTPYFSELRTDTGSFRVGDFAFWTEADTLVRMMLWWEIRYLVTEDFTGSPRTPTPWGLQFLAVDGDTGEPPPGDGNRSVLSAMLTATTTAAVDTVDPDAELHRRVWQGSSGGLPIVSHAGRSGIGFSGGAVLIAEFRPFGEGLPSPDGLWNNYPFWISMWVGALVENFR